MSALPLLMTNICYSKAGTTASQVGVASASSSIYTSYTSVIAVLGRIVVAAAVGAETTGVIIDGELVIVVVAAVDLIMMGLDLNP